MTINQYAIARSLAGPWMGPPEPRRYYLGHGVPGDLPGHPTAVYITELDDHRVSYVGQTTQGTAVRLRQHAGRPDRAGRWTWVWVVPVLEDTPKRELDRIEGRIGRWLNPTDTRLLPRGY